MNDHPEQSQPPTSDAMPETSRFRPLRVWPALLLLAVMITLRMLPRLLDDASTPLMMAAILGPAACGVLILLWWLLLSRATWRERIVGVVGVGLAAALTLVLVDRSMRDAGMLMLTVPMGTAAFAFGAILLCRRLSFQRTILAILLAISGFGYSALLRNEGMWGDMALGLHWRWQPSPEEQLLARSDNQSSAKPVNYTAAEMDRWLAEPEWPAFRGVDRTGRQHGSRLSTDWTADPPEQLWKVPVGPGWSSFSVAGKLLFTQEQRGPMETVVCYDADSGSEVWTQQIESRFDESLGGPGPRATPTIAGEGLFVLGASGQLMRLDCQTGEIVWQQDLRKIADRKPPVWGFCSSPLIVDAQAVVHAGGAGDKGILAFDIETGDLRWSATAGDHSYSSPQLGTIGNARLLLMLTNTGIHLLEPETGAERLNYEWKCNGYRALQPQIVDSDSILLPTGDGQGTRRIRISRKDDALVAQAEWTSRHLKPDFNDFVIYQNNAYGFDNTIFTCIDLKTGKRRWKGGRYGKGQVLLIKDSGLLLVAGEYGEVVLLKADPSGHNELAKFRAIEGKTWNHPVVVGDRLYIRNAQEAACYRLPLAAPE